MQTDLIGQRAFITDAKEKPCLIRGVYLDPSESGYRADVMVLVQQIDSDTVERVPLTRVKLYRPQNEGCEW